MNVVLLTNLKKAKKCFITQNMCFGHSDFLAALENFIYAKSRSENRFERDGRYKVFAKGLFILKNACLV